MLNSGDLVMYYDKYRVNPWDGMIILVLEPYVTNPRNTVYRVLIDGSVDVISDEFLSEVKDET